MPEYAYDRLSFLDNSFLVLESDTTHMHVAGVGIFEQDPTATSEGGVDIDAVRRFVAGRLDRIPRYRQRLAHVPLEGKPVWVDDDKFSIAYHVRHTGLPKPGSIRQLKRLTGRIISQPLDRRKPMWEIWVVEGLEGGRFALISKTHHCMIDGVASVDLLEVLLRPRPTDSEPEAVEFHPRPAPGSTELLTLETIRRVRRPFRALRGVRHLADEAATIRGELRERTAAVRHTVTAGWLRPAPHTPLNQKIGPHRRFDWLDMEVEDLKAVKNALGGTLNDVVLATVAGAVRTFFTEQRGFPVAGLDFQVMAPVSVRTREQRSALGNQVSNWLVHLPVDERRPEDRYRIVLERTARLKETNQALGAVTLMQLSSGTPTTLLALGSRLAARTRPFNMVVTNVPGPQATLYLLGSEMLAYYPVVPLWEDHGLGIALFSYAGHLAWGFNSDWNIMHDLHEFVLSIESSFAELQALAARRA